MWFKGPMAWKIKERLKGLAAKERGSVAKDWGGKVSVVPGSFKNYRVGMGNLAVHSIYGILNRSPGIACERAFLPGRFELHEHHATGTPVLSIESQRPLGDFDAIALTCSFENDYLNIIPILELSRIPHRSDERRDDAPLIIAGGAAATLNPAPLAPIADAVFAGEFEAFAGELIPILTAGLPKREALAALAKVPGVIVESAHAGVTRRHAEELNSFKTQTVIHARNVEFGDMHLIEIQRGCPRNCRFCATPIIYGAPRSRSAAAVMAMVEDGIPHRKRFGLIGADLFSHPEFTEIARAIHERGVTFSPSSIRVDAVDAEKAELLHASGHKSVALGIEAGSEGLRRTLGKGISDERILSEVATLAQAGITKLRLYFMIGLPGESDADVAAIVGISARVRDELRRAAPRSHRVTAVDITVTPFVPKPYTPFATRKFAGEGLLKQRVKGLRRLLAAEAGISMRTDSAVDAAIESLIANGDEGVIDFLEEAHRLGNPRAALRA